MDHNVKRIMPAKIRGLISFLFKGIEGKKLTFNSYLKCWLNDSGREADLHAVTAQLLLNGLTSRSDISGNWYTVPRFQASPDFTDFKANFYLS